MRVPSTTYTEAFTNDLNTLRARQSALQNQATTGLRVSAPGDDPAAMQSALNLVANKSAAQQYNANVTALQDRTGQIFSVLQSLTSLAKQAGADATTAGNGIISLESKSGLIANLNGLIKSAVDLANTQDATTGEGIFGGTSGVARPFTMTTDAAGLVTAVTYGGNNSTNTTEISSGAPITVDIPGANAAGSGARGLFKDSASGADFFANLIKLRDDIAAGNTSAVATTDTAALQKDSDNLIYHVGAIGAAQTRLDLTATTLQNQISALDKNISNATSTDLVQTIVQLNQAQNSYQAALQSGTKIMQLSILNYIQ
jgi:flagellar hook-associated protein 3 FlgL